MQLVFTKGAGKFDRLAIGSAVIDCPKQGIIPHDMVHFAVEAEVAARGFLGLAGDGDAGFTAGSDDPLARAIERLVETVQAEAWSGAPVAEAEFMSLYAVTCAARGDTPIALDASTLAAIRARLADLTAKWRAVPIGGTLELNLDVPTRE